MNATAPDIAQPHKRIQDFGEHIPGARKDLLVSTVVSTVLGGDPIPEAHRGVAGATLGETRNRARRRSSFRSGQRLRSRLARGSSLLLLGSHG